MKSTMNFHCFVTESLRAQCSHSRDPSEVFPRYHTISEQSFRGFKPSARPSFISSTFTLKGSPKMLWSYHPTSEPSCPHQLSSFNLMALLMNPYIFNVIIHVHAYQQISKLLLLWHCILTLSKLSLTYIIVT